MLAAGGGIVYIACCNILFRLLVVVLKEIVFCLELEGAVYFKLCFTYAPFLIYKFDWNNDCENVWCIDFELYRAALRSCVKAVDKKYIPVKDINERIF